MTSPLTLSTIATIIGTALLVTGEAGAALFAAVWAGAGLAHLGPTITFVLYAAAAVATFAIFCKSVAVARRVDNE